MTEVRFPVLAARSRALRAALAALAAMAFAAVPVRGSSGVDAAEPARSESPPGSTASFDLDHLAERGDHWVALSATGGEVPLTLDPDLQQAATKILASANAVRGGMVVIDARTGKVLVWAETARDGRPHRVLETARVPAASVFKVVTTAALFETTTLTPRDRVCISGGAHGIERRHLDPPRRDEALECAPFAYALGFSKNAVFAQLATHRLSRSNLLETAQALGFNGRVPFELDAPVGSLVVPYNDLEFARTAAGFQGSTLSPLGAAYLASVIAHGGAGVAVRISQTPRPAEDQSPARDPNTDTDTDTDESARPTTRVLSPRTAERLRKMMEVTVHSGTCRHAFSDEHGRPYLGQIAVSGKTGTLRPEANEGMTSWFMGFAPSEKPELIVSVMLENGAVWRRKANELARDLLRHYFHGHGRPHVSDPFEDPEPGRVASTGRRH